MRSLLRVTGLAEVSEAAKEAAMAIFLNIFVVKIKLEASVVMRLFHGSVRLLIANALIRAYVPESMDQPGFICLFNAIR